MDDETIISDAKQRSAINYDGGRLQWMQSFASIITIEGRKDMEYNGNDFSVLELKASDGRIIKLKFSDFRYHNSFYNGVHCSHSWEYDYDTNNARFINTVNNQLSSPDALAIQKGVEILKGYDFQTINKYGKPRMCNRLYTLTGNLAQDAAIIRRQVLRAQAFALLLAAK